METCHHLPFYRTHHRGHLFQLVKAMMMLFVFRAHHRGHLLHLVKTMTMLFEFRRRCRLNSFFMAKIGRNGQQQSLFGKFGHRNTT
jgi:hypothetical protein